MASALISGLKRLWRGKPYLLLVYLINLTVALVFGLILAKDIERSLGASMRAELVHRSFDDKWYNNFASQAEGLSATFTPTVVGIGAVLDGLDDFLRGNLFDTFAGITVVGIVYLLLWSFFSGGFIATSNFEAASFLQAGTRFFLRFVMLAAIAGVLYLLLFGPIMSGLSQAVASLTREQVDERIVFTYTVIKYVIVLTLAFSISMIFDYAKIIAVSQNLQNVLRAPIKAFGFILEQPGKAFGLYYALGLAWLAIMMIYWLIAPGANQSSWMTILGAFILGQVYILSRITIKALFYTGQTAFYSALMARSIPTEKEIPQNL